ncbi:hypothetical protein HU200_020786 [Digitaria exilis]|uniref:Uncharacterized protein n=1 Tax=Digitaria exilis TaxID=1010633 RepID=A0A835F0E5_9POAL|nr:hypothetical protein HU200_020786 [Digitaria exilis]
MKAYSLYWYLYFAFHLASPSFLVLFASRCCSPLTHGIYRPSSYELVALIGWEIRVIEHFLFFLFLSISIYAYLIISQFTHRIMLLIHVECQLFSLSLPFGYRSTFTVAST